MEVRNCKQCKKNFNFRACPTDISSGRGVFCSNKCKSNSSIVNIKIYCGYCKNEIFPRRHLKSKYCSRSCVNKQRVGMKLSEETRLKLSILKKGKKPKNFGVSFGLKGKLNNNWKGGITTKNEKIRKSIKYVEWRTSVFRRDSYTCQECGVKSKNIQAHHIKCFADFKESRFDINNGITLCKKCHTKTETYLNRWSIKEKTNETFNKNWELKDVYRKTVDSRYTQEKFMQKPLFPYQQFN